MGLFVGFGHNYVGVDYNIGTKLRLISDNKPTKVMPIMAMYGYNSVIKAIGKPFINKVFYGTTFRIGIDFKSLPSKNN